VADVDTAGRVVQEGGEITSATSLEQFDGLQGTNQFVRITDVTTRPGVSDGLRAHSPASKHATPGKYLSKFPYMHVCGYLLHVHICTYTEEYISAW